MTFLNPLLLFGLAAAALPLLIHLLNLRKLQTIDFSSLRFLKELQKTRIRRLKIRQILLLIIRTLLVIFLVLAFSRPAVEGNLAGTIGTHARSTMVIVLDDSPSLEVRNEKGVLFNQAREEAKTLLQLAGDDDEVYFLRLSSLRQSGDPPYTMTPGSALEALGELSASRITVPLVEAAGPIADILSRSANINKEVYFIGDGQRSLFSSQSVIDSVKAFDSGTRIFYLLQEGTKDRNLGIVSVTTSAQVLSAGRPATLETRILNSSRRDVVGLLVSIYLAGARVGQQSVDVQAGSSVLLSFTVIPKTAGILRGYIQLEDDAFESDNRRHFILNIPETIRIGLVGSAEETRYARMALTAVDELGARGLFEIDPINQSRLSSADFAQWDVLFLCGVSDLSATEGERLVRFVKAGGGLLLFPGEKPLTANLNRVLFGPMEVPLADDPAAQAADGTAYQTFSQLDLAHPLFFGLFQGKQQAKGGRLKIESPQIRRHLRLNAGTSGNPLIRLSDGTPFLIEYGIGSGRLFLFAVDAALAWSDFPLKGLYAPLINRSALYLAVGQSPETGTIVGSPALIRLRSQRAVETSYRIRTPDGITERAAEQVNPVTGLTTFVSPPTRETGIYELVSEQAPDTPLSALAVNLDPAESDLRVATREEMVDFFSSLGAADNHIVVSGSGDDLVRVVQESRYGVELWKYLLMGAIALALFEMAIARVSRKELVEGEAT